VRRRGEIRAVTIVPAAPQAVFEFLADLENHWRLADRFIEVVDLERDSDGRAHGGRVRMRGPLGLRRTAATRVLAAEPPQLIVGLAEIGLGTRAYVRWRLAPQAGATRVTLEAAIDRVGPLDRVALALGGRRWLKRRLDTVVARLAVEAVMAQRHPRVTPLMVSTTRNRSPRR
jgi:uncharacterized protein YndB with AHSA1/START domain